MLQLLCRDIHEFCFSKYAPLKDNLGSHFSISFTPRVTYNQCLFAFIFFFFFLVQYPMGFNKRVSIQDMCIFNNENS